MGLDDGGRHTDGMALVHLVVEGLKRRLLSGCILVGDGTLSCRLSGGFVLIEPDPWLLGLSVALDGPDRAEVLDELGDLGLEG